MKKVLAVAATVSVLTTGIVSNVYAQEEVKNPKNEEKVVVKEEKKMDKETRKMLEKKLKYDSKKVTQEDIEGLSDQMIKRLSEEEGEIVSISTTTRTLDTKNSDGVSTLTMPQSDFKMTTVAKRIYEKGASYDNFLFIAEGDWIASPFYEYVDTIALAWSDNFTLYSDKSYVVRRYSDRTVYDYQYSWRNKATPEAGVGHDVDLQAGLPDSEVFLEAKVYKPNSSDTANVVGEYGHLTKSLSVSLSFGAAGGVPEVGMSVSEKEELQLASPHYDDFVY